MIQKSNTCAGLISAFSRSIKGFTLIELLVVVIIIAVLAAVAVPMYKRAVLKSRFSTVMPMAKAVADAQEVYYLGNGQYALDKAELDITPVEANNTTVALSPTDGYDYVLAQRSDVPEVHYVMYQKHSENYPGEIHCEAQDENDMAVYLCQSIGGTQDIGKTITDGYTTYIISGTGAVAPNFNEAEDTTNPMSCDKAIEMGFTCTANTETNTKQMCKTVGNRNVCRTKTYNEDGSYTSVTCILNAQGVCGFHWVSSTYDANGNQLTTRSCNNIDNNSGNCVWYGTDYTNDYTYDAAGNMLSQRKCSSVDSSGNCTAYDASNSYDYTYDSAGNMLSQRQCSGVDSSGNCTVYRVDSSYDYTYDASGNQLTKRNCSAFDSNGNCTSYNTMYSYTYDASGNQLAQRICYSFDSNDNCTSYGTNYGYDYTYDAAGNQLTALRCKSIGGSGNCMTYDSWGNYNYTYDTAGNQLTKRNCRGVDSNGNCTGYKSDDNYDYTYDAAGNMLSQRQCSSVDSSGNCTAYGSVYVYAYDDNGKQVYSQYCGGSNFNTATGECIASDGTYTTPN